MSIASPPDPYVVLYAIPWEQYGRITEALGEYHLRHTYDQGTLEMRGLLYGVAWDAYKEFLDALGDYSLRHTYDRGTLEMMSPRKDHDWTKTIPGRLIEHMCLELDIDIQSIGSTTLTSDAAERGLQPDETYYVANEPIVRGKDTYDPDIDPPPDLALEIDVTHSSVKRLPVFAALKVPEVWRHTKQGVQFLRLKDDGSYEQTDRSLAFPFLTTEDIDQTLAQHGKLRENELVRSFAKLAKQRRDDFSSAAGR